MSEVSEAQSVGITSGIPLYSPASETNSFKKEVRDVVLAGRIVFCGKDSRFNPIRDVEVEAFIPSELTTTDTAFQRQHIPVSILDAEKYAIVAYAFWNIAQLGAGPEHKIESFDDE
jgi:hypothetical protein